MLEDILKQYTFTAETFIEDDGTITGALNEIDIVENAQTEQELLEKLAKSLYEYARDFFADFQYWYSAQNRRFHLPYVLNILIQGDIGRVKELICLKG